MPNKLDSLRDNLSPILGGGTTTFFTFEYFCNLGTSIFVGLCVTVISWVIIDELKYHWLNKRHSKKKNKDTKDTVK
jgi:H+/gluconate symporter-like permease